jgi:hypothetical protein
MPGRVRSGLGGDVRASTPGGLDDSAFERGLSSSVTDSSVSQRHESFPEWTYEDEPEDPALTRSGTLGGAGAFGSRDSGGRSSRLSLFDPGRRGVKALAAAALLVVTIAAVLAWRARPRVDPVVVPPVDAQVAAASTVRGGGGAAPSAGTPSGGAEVVVAVGARFASPDWSGCRPAPGSPTRCRLRAARSPVSTSPCSTSRARSSTAN